MPAKYKKKKIKQTITVKKVTWDGFKRRSETVTHTQYITGTDHDHNIPLPGDTSALKNQKPLTIKEELAKCIRDKRKAKKQPKRITR